MDPKVSVIVPVYNTEQYLRECLDSILSQTLKEIEIIIINDCSPDNSIEIIRKYEKEDNRIKVIDKKQNEGVGQARNDGLKKATGEFVCFIDSDDLYSSAYVLEKLYNAAKENCVPVSGGNLQKLDSDGTLMLQENPIIINKQCFCQRGLTQYSDFQYDYGYTCYIFDRKMLIENDVLFPFYGRFQDPPFFVKAMYCAKEFFYLDEPIYIYRLLPSGNKFQINKTVDFLCGVMDNLRFSREHNLAKLHCLSAYRLNTEGSFMAIQNLYNEGNDKLLAKLIEANQAVDVKWLKENGFDIKEPFVLDVFKYAVDTAGKYEKLRNKRFIKILKRIIK